MMRVHKTGIGALLAGLVLCGSVHAFDLGEIKQTLRDNVQKKDTSGALSGLGGTSQEDEIAIGRQIAGDLLGAAPLPINFCVCALSPISLVSSLPPMSTKRLCCNILRWCLRMTWPISCPSTPASSASLLNC